MDSMEPVTSQLFRIHHLGVAVGNLDEGIAFYESAFGSKLISGPFLDPIQRVRVCFLRNDGEQGPLLELISPIESASPVTSMLAKGTGAYHICYEVANLEKAQTEMRARKCLPIGVPSPAVAFGGRRIAWWYTPTKHLVEIVEAKALIPSQGEK